jgi:hypothetical protein
LAAKETTETTDTRITTSFDVTTACAEKKEARETRNTGNGKEARETRQPRIGKETRETRLTKTGTRMGRADRKAIQAQL